MIRTVSLCLAAALLAGTLVAAAGLVERTGAATPAMQVGKTSFVKTVVSSNKLEIDSSKLALEKTVSADTKAFAEQMIADHTKAGEDLWRIIGKQGGEPPAAELLPKHAAGLKSLEGKDGADFEDAYIKLQQDAHAEAVELFRAYAGKPDDDALGGFAARTLPTLEMHLDHIGQIAAAH